MKNSLDDVMKRLRTIYVPAGYQRESDLVNGPKYSEIIQIKGNKKRSKFENLIKEINAILFYLSNVEV